MKNFPFRLLFVWMFLPSVCYILTIPMLQGCLQRVEASRLHHVLVRDFEALDVEQQQLIAELFQQLGQTESGLKEVNAKEEDSQVSVRKKVFGRGGKMNILEVEFSYSGKIYIRKNPEPKTKVMVIGTKNSQKKDLAFLEGAG